MILEWPAKGWEERKWHFSINFLQFSGMYNSAQWLNRYNATAKFLVLTVKVSLLGADKAPRQEWLGLAKL